MAWNLQFKTVKENNSRPGRGSLSKTFLITAAFASLTICSFYMQQMRIQIIWNNQELFAQRTRSFPSSKHQQQQLHCPSLMNGTGVPTFKTRMELPKILQNEGFKIGIELGVQYGHYSQRMLSKWTNCTEYHLVDVWAHQENYEDYANVRQEEQEDIYNTAMKTLEAYRDKIHVCRNYTTVCVETYPDDYFDFIYVDARHDFKGVWEDLVAYWPKLKVGGIMAGHDYVTNKDGPLPAQDWSKNYDGTIDETGTVVKGAVDKFAAAVCRQITVSYRESAWNTWAMRK